jgi:hypothetical protein
MRADSAAGPPINAGMTLTRHERRVRSFALKLVANRTTKESIHGQWPG